jgi:hypothetical protein
MMPTPVVLVTTDALLRLFSDGRRSVESTDGPDHVGFFFGN